MKARVNVVTRLTAKEKQSLKHSIEEMTEEQCRRALVRVQYLMFLTMHDVFDIGEKRFYEKFLPAYQEMLDTYNIWKEDEVQDVMLQRAVKSAFPSIEDIFKNCPDEKISFLRE